jgi:hypothetical protein
MYEGEVACCFSSDRKSSDWRAMRLLMRDGLYALQ